MFDFAWSEFALIGVVALLVIGPKDMPVAIRTVAKAVRKMRGLAGEFQSHVDEMVREADLGEVRDHVRSLRSLDVRGKIMRTIDEDGRLRRSLDDPIARPPSLSGTSGQTAALPSHGDTTQPPHVLPPPGQSAPDDFLPHIPVRDYSFPDAGASEAPACIPPSVARRIVMGREHMMRTPAFLPPVRVLHGERRIAPFDAPAPEKQA
ncbi:Sec-independent protein translocase protein TatB [Acetobacter oeni]|uniref:Sec-independent protein translocase protein TatB n=1 Tax=Acetobacter oeni TaxID=304077 RepID=A0A511XLQ7_9PROT|nr:Sec-independent protein translocase protein TatB [Acetobacter oeni]MBB3884310.1 sec-independent protein translocase protein TatB [Acetobacter oeni]NHO20244.1 twin-arginine translocase subunit TatB [Acetobacter oeni]GEN63864.1 hypothetical protein AOE01nite_20880 [Acetobacter oeni]